MAGKIGMHYKFFDLVRFGIKKNILQIFYKYQINLYGLKSFLIDTYKTQGKIIEKII